MAHAIELSPLNAQQRKEWICELMLRWGLEPDEALRMAAGQRGFQPLGSDPSRRKGIVAVVLARPFSNVFWLSTGVSDPMPVRVR